MTFTPDELVRLEAWASATDAGPQAAAQFRQQFPGRSLTRCDASDMGAEAPFRSYAAVDVYLVDGRDHCWALTHDPLRATGVVLARRRARA